MGKLSSGVGRLGFEPEKKNLEPLAFFLEDLDSGFGLLVHAL